MSLEVQAEQKGDLAGMIALEGALKFNGGGTSAFRMLMCI